MFTAVRCDGKELSLLRHDYERKELEEERKKHQYFCPECKGQVILKLGYRQAWHFAHSTDSSCEAYQRGETDIHHRAKWLIYHWLKEHDYQPKVERYLKSIKQRPDILVDIDGLQTVFEVQRAAIEEQHFKKRWENFAKIGYEQIWFGLMTSSTNKGKPPYYYSTEKLHSLLMRTEPELHGVFLNVDTQTWHIYKKIRFISPQKIIAIPQEMPLHVTPNNFIQEINLTSTIQTTHFDQFYYSTWKNEINKKRKQVYLSVTPTERSMLRIFQKYQLNLNYFPAICALPLKTNIHFITSPMWWQSWIVLELINKTALNETISISYTVNALNRCVHMKMFHLRPLNMNKKDLMREAVIDYFQYLTFFRVLEKKFIGVFIVRKHVKINKQLHTLCADDDYVQSLMRKI